jgi:lipooligosaccharide transport system ATP-binding protein
LRFPVEINVDEQDLAGLAKRIESLPDRSLLYTDNADDTLVRLTERPFAIESTLVRRATLEDVFLRLTGRSLID